MEYGCIGEKLVHSFSKEIHNKISDYNYELKEVSQTEFNSFMSDHNFKAVNVTIPYKEKVIPYLYYQDDSVKEIGACNTIKNIDGKLYGYNTDFLGMKSLISYLNISLKDKKVLIMGTGGTSKTATAVAKNLKAREIIRVSRSGREDAITYEKAYSCYKDADVIINTTPSGMYPNCENTPIDICKFENLSGVIDVIYNPLKTNLLLNAEESGIKFGGGLYMVVAQAVFASEIFLDTKYDVSLIERIYKELLSEKQNVVLIGMPSSGKTTVGKLLAQRLDKKFVDTDEIILEKIGMEIKDYFEQFGEQAFRKVEEEVINEISNNTGLIIATGGGVVLSDKNIKHLKRNGKIYFLNRPLNMLTPTSDRPTASSVESIKKRYFERYDLYCSSADKIIEINEKDTPNKTTNDILDDFIK